MMKSVARRAILCGAMLGAAGCSLLTGSDADPAVCRQTYEFGNYGCARMVVTFQPPPKPWPAGYRWDVRVRAVREGTGAGAAFPPYPDTLPVTLELIRYQMPDPGSEDTSSVWVVAKMLEDSRAIGVPLPVFAADSLLHVARFAPVGSRPPVDTIRLTLRVRN
jgi:hypothetical protein